MSDLTDLLCDAFDAGALRGEEEQTASDEVQRQWLAILAKAQALDAILDIAMTAGRHWRDQEGVNGAVLDELARVTAPKDHEP